MDIYFIVGHRKERYDGEHMPEILEVVDEVTMDENPDWLPDKYTEYADSKEFNVVKIIETKISTTELIEILYTPDKIKNTGIKEIKVEEL